MDSKVLKLHKKLKTKSIVQKTFLDLVFFAGVLHIFFLLCVTKTPWNYARRLSKTTFNTAQNSCKKAHTKFLQIRFFLCNLPIVFSTLCVPLWRFEQKKYDKGYLHSWKINQKKILKLTLQFYSKNGPGMQKKEAKASLKWPQNLQKMATIHWKSV